MSAAHRSTGAAAGWGHGRARTYRWWPLLLYIHGSIRILDSSMELSDHWYATAFPFLHHVSELATACCLHGVCILVLHAVVMLDS